MSDAIFVIFIAIFVISIIFIIANGYLIHKWYELFASLAWPNESICIKLMTNGQIQLRRHRKSITIFLLNDVKCALCSFIIDSHTCIVYTIHTLVRPANILSETNAIAAINATPKYMYRKRTANNNVNTYKLQITVKCHIIGLRLQFLRFHETHACFDNNPLLFSKCFNRNSPTPTLLISSKS